MYLINESLKELKQKIESMCDVSDGVYEDNIDVKTTWHDYVKLECEKGAVERYDIGNPMELMERLRNLWIDDEGLTDDEFIKLFTVAAFRQTIETNSRCEEIPKEKQVSIPTYIYNF